MAGFTSPVGELNMKKLRNLSLAAAGLAALWQIGSLMNSRSAVLQAANGPIVTIDPSQLPLPISGSTTVAGTVAASQSGPWTVGITGTPNVTVTNPATAPVFFRNVDDPGRTPYESPAQCVVGNNNSLCSAIFGAVPPNHRLVVQHVSPNVIVSPNIGVVSVAVSRGLFNTFSNFTMTVSPISITSGMANSDKPVLGYLDAGDRVTVTAIMYSDRVSDASVIAGGEVVISGYLLDCSVAPCAPIAR